MFLLCKSLMHVCTDLVLTIQAAGQKKRRLMWFSQEFSSMTSRSAGWKMNSLTDELLKQKGTSELQEVQGKLFLLLDTRQVSWPLLLCYILMRQRFREHLGPLTLFWRSSLSAEMCHRSLSSVSETLSAIFSLSHSFTHFWKQLFYLEV